MDLVTIPADLVTFTEEILNGKIHFLRSVLGFQHSSFYIVSLIVREIKPKVVVFYQTKVSQRKTLNVGKRKEKDK